MSGKELLVFANEFPYSNYETYMETEMYFWEKFERVYIFSLQLRRKNRKIHREVPDNCSVIPVLFNPLAYIAWIVSALLDKNTYEEIHTLIEQRKLNSKSFAQLFAYVSRSHYEAYVILKKQKKERINLQEPVFYSYRFGYQPYVALLVKKKIAPNSPIYCRAHGYDLYENLKSTNYIPMRRFILREITKCFPVSDAGTSYLKSRYAAFSDKIETRYLGTNDAGRSNLIRKGRFTIVSCSSVVAVKRMDLIIDALALIEETQLTWVHFGNGPLMDEMKSRADKTLHDNIKVEWRGNVDNKVIIEEYCSGFFHMFINTSRSEGIPVSIMEAISTGIPVVATDVGGTREIIKDGINGTLMPPDVTPEEISRAILTYVNMEDKEYQGRSSNARLIWEKNFNAKDNYELFVSDIC